MTRTLYPRSVAKYIRRQKARIRRQWADSQEATKRMNELLATVESSKRHEKT